MALNARVVTYYHTIVKDEPGEAYNLLTILEKKGINLQAFHAVPVGEKRTQLTLFLDDDLQLVNQTKLANLKLFGPHAAILVQGDDDLGMLANLHLKLFHAQVNVLACNGVSDGKGHFGYVISVRPEDIDNAFEALKF